MPALPQSLLDSAIDTESERSDNALSASIKSMVAPVMQQVQSIKLPDLGSLLGSGSQQVSSLDASGAGLGSAAAVPVAPAGQPPSPTAGAQPSSGFSLPSLQSLLGGGQPSTSQSSQAGASSTTTAADFGPQTVASGTRPPAGAISPNSTALPMPTGQPPTATGQDLRSYARQKAQSLGINPDVAERVANTEGGFDNPVRQNMQGAPAYGPYQLYIGGPNSPGLGDEALARGIDPRNVAQTQQAVDFALEHAAKNGWGAFQGAAANGIGQWEGIGQAPAVGTAPTRSQPAIPAASMPEQATRQGGAYSGSYTQQNLANQGDPDAWTKCGPVAIFQAAQVLGKTNLTPAEVEAAAKARGWTARNGMAGLQSEAATLNDMKIAATTTEGPVDWQHVIADVSRGNPVILQLPGHDGHYITAQAYDANTGKIDFGSTVGDLRAAGHKTQFTPQELEALGWGSPNGALWIDNPATPAPSVVAGQSASPSTGAGTPISPSGSTPSTTASSSTAQPTPTSDQPMSYRLPLGASPALNDASPSVVGGDASAAAPAPGASPPGAGAFADDYTQNGQVSPWAQSTSTSSFPSSITQPAESSLPSSNSSGLTPPMAQQIPNEDQTQFPRPEYVTPASPLVTSNDANSGLTPPPSPYDQQQAASMEPAPNRFQTTEPTPTGALTQSVTGAVSKGISESMTPGNSMLDMIPQAINGTNADENTLKWLNPAIRDPLLAARRAGFTIMTGEMSGNIANELWAAAGFPNVDVAGFEINPGQFLVPGGFSVGGGHVPGMLRPGMTGYGTALAGGLERGAEAAITAGRGALQSGAERVSGAVRGIGSHLAANAAETAALDAERAGQPAAQELANAAPTDVASQNGPAFNAALGAAPARAAVGAGVGAVTGGTAGYNAAPEDATPPERAAYTAAGVGAGALAGTTIAGAGTLAAGKLIDSLVQSGRLNPRVLATHPQTPDRIRALFSLAAEGLPDDAIVQAPAMADAMIRMRPQLAQRVPELLSGPVTAGQVRQIVGDAGSPGVVQTVQEMAVDALTGLAARARRGREMAADAATVRGLADEAQQATRGRLASSDPTFPTRDGLGRLVDPERQPNLTGFVNEVADNLGVERPSIYVTDSPHVNASATTKDGGGNAIIINRGLLQAGLTDDEMAAVLTHELAHTAQDSRSPVARAFGAVRDAVGSGGRDVQGALPGGGQPPQQPPVNLPPAAQNWYQQQATKNAAEMTAKGIQPLDPVRWVRNLGSTIGYSSMIGPGTFSVSLASNALEPLYAIPKEITRGGVRAIQTGRMEALLREPMTMASGAMTGLGHVGQALWDVIRAKGAYAANPDMAPLSQRTADPSAKLLAQVLEVPGRVWSGVPDAIFGTVAEHAGRAREAAQIATDHGLSGQQWSQAVSTLLSQAQQAKTGTLANAPALVQQVVKAGEDYGARLSYRDPLGTIGKQVKTATSLGNIPVFSNLVAPFFNTPWNIMLRQGERSPIGLAMNTQKGFDKYYDAIVGSALVLGLGSAAQAGRVTGSGPSDQGQRKLLEADGWKPYSTLVNGVYIPNRLFGIGETLLNAAGDAHDFTVYRKPTDDARTLQTDALARIGNLVSQQPFAAGYSSIADLVNFGPESFAADQAVRMTPFASTARMVGTAMDTKERRPDTGSDVTLGQDIAGRYAAGVGNRAGLPAAQDVLGHEKPNLQQGAWAVLPRMSPQTSSPVADAFRGANMTISPPPSDVSGVALSPDQKRRYQALMGQQLEQMATPVVTGANWDSMPLVAKKAVLGALLDASRTVAEAQVQGEGGSDFSNRLTDSVVRQSQGLPTLPYLQAAPLR